jgi:formylglycine-generating enzyme required for sulfatase activity
MGLLVADEARPQAPSRPADRPTSAPTTRKATVYRVWPFDANEAARRQAETARSLGIPARLALDLGNKVTVEFALIPAGRFVMGSPKEQKDHYRDEGPPHEVEITRPFYMGVFHVTQEQYKQVMGKNPSGFQGPSHPVEKVSWEDAAEFCKAMSQKTGMTLRLPAESQWEYACRAGTATPFHTGTIRGEQPNADGTDSAGDAKAENLRGKTTPVGIFQPNAFGLYDMHGNVYQWCADWYDEEYYGKSPKADPEGPSTGSRRVARGGFWFGGPGVCRSASRFHAEPDRREVVIGFRVACLLPTGEAEMAAFVGRVQAEDAKVTDLIRRLADDNYKVREEATRMLTEMSGLARSLLRARLEDKSLDPEAAVRIRLVLEKTAPDRGEAVARDPVTGMTVSIEDGVVTARGSKGIIWTTRVQQGGQSVKIERGQVVVSPGNAVLDLMTGKLLEGR